MRQWMRHPIARVIVCMAISSACFFAAAKKAGGIHVDYATEVAQTWVWGCAIGAGAFAGAAIIYLAEFLGPRKKD